MSYADWDIIGDNLATLNSDVIGVNTLPAGFGTFCRRISGANTKLLISGTYQAAAFVGIPSNKVIRTSLAIRKWFNTNIYNGGLVAKYTNGIATGYSVCYDASYQAIILKANDGSNYSLGVTYPGGNVDNTWFNMRMEIQEIAAGTDRILVSQEDPLGSGTWNLVSINGGVPANGIIFTSAQSQYAPWGGVTRNGIVGEIAAGHNQGGIFFDKYSIELLDPPPPPVFFESFELNGAAVPPGSPPGDWT